MFESPIRSPASRRRRISSMISRSPAIATSSAAVAACRAARPSSAARASRISTASRSEMRLTRGAAVALALHQPVVLEAHQRHPHGRTPQPEPRAQILLEQALPGQQLSVNDRLAQILVTVGPDRHSVPLVWLRH